MKETKFKQTEVGMIPSDWEVKRVDDCGVLKSGESPSNFTFSSSGIPYFKVDQMNNCNKYQVETPYYILEHVSIPKGSILFPKRGAAIETNKIRILEQDSFFDTNIMGLTLDSSVHNEYFFYWLVKKELWKIADTTSVPQINNKHIKPLLFPCPTIEEQQRIANALSDVDTLINNLEKLIAKKKNIKQGAMQQLLTGRKRLPGFGLDERTGLRPTDERRKACHSERSTKCEVEESNGYKMTELGMIPTDWEVKTFGELFDILPNNTLSRAELNEDSGSFKNVHYGDVLVKFPEWIDCSKNTLPFINSGAKFNHTALQDGDVIIADTAEDETVGKSTEIYNVGKMKIVSGLHTIPIRPKKKFASKWLGYFINSACWHDQILPFITGTKVSAISKTAIAETKFFYPAKIDEQTAIANVLSDMDTEISTLETKLAKYRTLKTGMMQQLLTGKIRLV